MVFVLVFNLFAVSYASAESNKVENLSTSSDYVEISAQESVALAEVPDNIKNLISDNTVDKVILVSDPKDAAERFTLRTENSETGEGTLTIHSVPVKYVDQSGKFQFIDTSMKSLTKAESAKNGFSFRNSANSFTVEFGNTAAKGINFDNVFTFRADSNTAGSGSGKIQTEKGQGSIIYPAVFGSDTKVEYINTESGLKENIILDKYTGQNRFDFTFSSDTHVPILTENGMNILVADKNDLEKIEYRFLSLYAYDSYDPAKDPEQRDSDFRHMNEDLYYELTANEDSTYTITVVVPEKYLTHPEIVYPVTIDPSLEPYVSSNSNAQDTFVDAGNPTSYSNGSLDYIRFGKVNGNKNFGYHRFSSLPYLPSGAVVTSAYLKFTFRSGQTTPSVNSGIKMWTLRVTDHQWYESSLTWNNQPYGSSGPYTDITYKGSYLDYFNANITDMVKAWYSGSPNYGIDFTYSNEDYNDYNSVVSSEGEAHRAPVLTVNYSIVPVTGISVSPTNVTLNINGTRSLSATISPSNATNKKVIWSSSNTSIATVSSTGVVTAKSPGTVKITARSQADSSKCGYCYVVVKDKTFDIVSSLSRDEYYYLVYPPGLGPIIFISNFPESPVISTLSWEKKLLSIPISRKYNSQPANNTTYDALKNELNQALGTNYTRSEASKIHAQYGLAIMTTPFGPGMPAHLYTPESVQKCQSDYMGTLHTLATLVTFKVAANLNPFDANGNIKFKPDIYTKYYDANGNPIWPGTNGNVHTDGFVNGYCQPFTFEKGDVFDRYGSRTGRFVAPVGTPYSARALAPGSNFSTYEKYIVNKPFDAYVGITAPWFNQPGGGIQYKLTMTIQELIDGNYISPY